MFIRLVVVDNGNNDGCYDDDCCDNDVSVVVHVYQVVVVDNDNDDDCCDDDASVVGHVYQVGCC